jgi:hypothetical protein
VTEKVCRAAGCERAIPIRQPFCRRCLDRLSAEIRHTLLFGSDAEKQEALEAADRQLSGRTVESIRPQSPARERFKAARKHIAAAMKTLERKPR